MGRIVVRRRSARAQREVPFAITVTPYSFGADAPMSEEDWRTSMLEEQRKVSGWQERWVKRDELQRWIQIGATLAIPLSAAIWKAIFRAGRRRKSE